MRLMHIHALNTVLALAGVGVVAIVLMERPSKVVDGDTVKLAGFGNIRLVGVDTPELRSTCEAERVLARRARDRATELLTGGVPVIEWSRERDKYGRPMARIRIDGRDLGEVLVSEGLARPYDGGAREPWC